jgi:hypothetical protein
MRGLDDDLAGLGGDRNGLIDLALKFCGHELSERSEEYRPLGLKVAPVVVAFHSAPSCRPTDGG